MSGVGHYIEDAVLLVVGALLSAYTKELIRICHRGWLRGRLNTLEYDVSQIEAMNTSLTYLVSSIGYTMLRVLFGIGLMIVWQSSHPDLMVLVFGALTSEIGMCIRRLTRLNNYAAFTTTTTLKVQKLRNRLSTR